MIQWTLADIQAEDVESGNAIREDWQYILRNWLRECDEPDRYRRLLDIHSRCLHDGEHPIEAALDDEERASGKTPRPPRHF